MLSEVGVHVLCRQSVPEVPGRSAHSNPRAPAFIGISLDNAAFPVTDWWGYVNPVGRIFRVATFLKTDAHSDLLTFVTAGFNHIIESDYPPLIAF